MNLFKLPSYSISRTRVVSRNSTGHDEDHMQPVPQQNMVILLKFEAGSMSYMLVNWSWKHQSDVISSWPVWAACYFTGYGSINYTWYFAGQHAYLSEFVFRAMRKGYALVGINNISVIVIAGVEKVRTFCNYLLIINGQRLLCPWRFLSKFAWELINDH